MEHQNVLKLVEQKYAKQRLYQSSQLYKQMDLRFGNGVLIFKGNRTV